MARRSWRNFDYPLLAAVLLLSAYGVVMIYSATINTLGVEDSARRQMVFAAAGLAVLVIAASVDYRLLELIQHPLVFLPPLVLGAASAAVLVVWQAKSQPASDSLTAASVFVPQIAPILVGLALMALVFALDRAWIEKIDLPQTRALAAAAVIVAVGVAAWALRRLPGSDPLTPDPGRLVALTPYLLVSGLAAVYLLDCLTLRATDLFRNVLFVLILSLLGITVVLGQTAGGARSWLGAGRVQPSELTKILLIVILAKLLSDRQERMDQFSTVLVSLVAVAVPALLIYLQPDLGTALCLVASWGVMVWIAGIRFRHLFILGGLGILGLPLVWFALEDYMRQRLLLFVNPAGDPDSYFNVHQALVSIGSGGWIGKGLTHGTQNQLHFLRVRHTDFIFAVTAEELGFLGAVALICLLFYVLWRTLRVAERARDHFGRLLAGGMAALIAFQAIINIGMNLGVLPVTGLPLPFVSYGGSSMLTLMLGVGLIESVAMRHKKLEFD